MTKRFISNLPLKSVYRLSVHQPQVPLFWRKSEVRKKQNFFVYIRTFLRILRKLQLQSRPITHHSIARSTPHRQPVKMVPSGPPGAYIPVHSMPPQMQGPPQPSSIPNPMSSGNSGGGGGLSNSNAANTSSSKSSSSGSVVGSDSESISSDRKIEFFSSPSYSPCRSPTTP